MSAGPFVEPDLAAMRSSRLNRSVIEKELVNNRFLHQGKTLGGFIDKDSLQDGSTMEKGDVYVKKKKDLKSIEPSAMNFPSGKLSCPIIKLTFSNRSCGERTKR